MDLEDVGYHVLGPIARGGMAEVVLAERVGPGGVRKRMAIKRLLPELAADPEFVLMLENEARIAVELDHANVVSVFELGEADGELFLAMEFVRGWDLATVLDRCAQKGTKLPLAAALHIAKGVCLALAYAHEKKNDHGVPLGIVHRDVSPSNVLLSVDGAVKLADFGIARAAASAKTPAVWQRAKVPYMSPEQASGEKLDGRSDLYSLGVVLFEMLTNKRLFPGELASAARARTQPIPSLADLRPDACSLSPLLERMLAVAPASRHASARAIVEALGAAAAGLGSHDGASVLADFLRELALSPPVGPDNIAEGERTEPIVAPRSALVRAPAVAVAPAPARAPASRASARTLLIGVMAALAVFVATATITRRVLQPMGTLDVRTMPAGATVWIDGQARGTTPLVLHDLPRRMIVVRVGFSLDRASEVPLDLTSTRDQELELDVR